MKYVQIAAALFAAAGLLVLGLLVLLPRDYAIARSRVIPAPPAQVFAVLDDLTIYDQWSPWTAMDPDIVVTVNEPGVGVGAHYAWTSDTLGSGTMEITKSVPDTHLELAMLFDGMEPALVTYDVVPTAGGSEVTWGITGRNTGVFGGVFATIMEPMIGPTFEDGLARLEGAVAARPLPAPVAEIPPADVEAAPSEADAQP